MDKHDKANEISLLDYLIIIVRHKKMLFGATFLFMVVFYLLIFFFVDEQFKANATIIPSQDNSISGLAGALGGLSDLPFDIGGLNSNPEIGLYNTILYSRSNLERVIEKFNLWEVYNLDKSVPKEVKRAREALFNSINTEETDDGSYVIVVSMPNPELAADVTNDLVEYLNNKIIELKVKKSRNNRIFLGQRLAEVRSNLKNAEDSLKIFQKQSGMLNPEEQIRGLISVYSKFEQQLIVKEAQKEILNELVSENSPQLKSLNLEIDFLEKRIKDLQSEGKTNSIFVPFASIPQKAVDYYRYYREVEINGTILQFVLPLYEQAKLEEQKEIPVIQIIDYAIPPEEKYFPPRTLFTLLWGILIFLILFSYILLKENKNIANSEKLLFIRKNLFKWNITS